MDDSEDGVGVILGVHINCLFKAIIHPKLDQRVKSQVLSKGDLEKDKHVFVNVGFECSAKLKEFLQVFF